MTHLSRTFLAYTSMLDILFVSTFYHRCLLMATFLCNVSTHGNNSRMYLRLTMGQSFHNIPE